MDEAGKTVYESSTPYMEDAKGEISDKISLEILETGEGFARLKIIADREWLSEYRAHEKDNQDYNLLWDEHHEMRKFMQSIPDDLRESLLERFEKAQTEQCQELEWGEIHY